MLRTLVALALVAQAASQVPPPASEVVLRFHHFHYVVDDPSASMRQAADATGGTRVLLPGLGLGVRVGAEYVLFERPDPAAVDPTNVRRGEPYAAAVRWLRERSLTVAAESGATRLAEAAGKNHAHIGFAAADLAGAAAALERAGAQVLRRTEASVMFDMGDGRTIEMVRDTSLPDAFWCPMHPDVRAPVAGTCPICRMRLEPIPPPRVGEYRMDVTLEPTTATRAIPRELLRTTPGRRGAWAMLDLVIRDPETGRVVTDFVTVHERPVHLFIVGRDWQHFEHVHPDVGADGGIRFAEPLPPGEYLLVADFLPAGGTPQTLQRMVVTPGLDPPVTTPSRLPRQGGTTVIMPGSAGARVRMDAPDLRAGHEGRVSFTYASSAGDTPVTDLESYLGAPAHILLVSEDLTHAVHAHPVEADTTGPRIDVDLLLPTPGAYMLWIQVQRRGQVLTTSFVVVAR